MLNHGERKQSVREFIDNLQSEGRYAFTEAELVEGVGGTKTALRAALHRLKKRERIASPRKQFFVIVPLEYRSSGILPASWFIEDLMGFLGQPYYVGLLSAAAIHGASHQFPQIFQVVTDLPTEPTQVGNVKITFYRKRSIAAVSIMRVKTDAGLMTVSTPEATVFDLIRFRHVVGDLSNVATVVSELGAAIDPAQLTKASEIASTPELQRLGYLFELTAHDLLADALAEELRGRRTRPIALKLGQEYSHAPKNARWNLYINDQVEPE